MKSFIVLSCVLAVAVASYVPTDTPEVAAAKAQHFAAHQQATARNWASDVVVNNQWAAAAPAWNSVWAARAGNWYAPSWQRYYNPAQISVVNGHVQDTPEVAAEKAKHFALVAEAQARNAGAGGEWSEVVAPVVSHVAPAVVSRVAPVVSHVAPVAPLAAVADVHSQYHAQDEAGQYSYGYNGGLSTKNEEKTVDGVTRGAFSYVDSNGVVQSRSYVADALGFRVAATDLPEGPAPVAAGPLVSAAPIATEAYYAGPVAAQVPAQVIVKPDGTLEDTPEVAAAKAQHFHAHQQEHARLAGGAW